MRQRAMIAMALSCKPKILVADEPTTALDVTIQAQILDLMKQLQDEEDMSAIYISHNLGVVAEQVDYIYVMYLGRVVESAPTEELFNNPLHPYTQRLLRAAPRPGRRAARLEVIEGSVPVPIGRSPECGFSSRCPQAFDRCVSTIPALKEFEPDHFVRCFLYGEEGQAHDEWTNVGVA
jgi:peptide/nickel transport system ATP-binding protein